VVEKAKKIVPKKHYGEFEAAELVPGKVEDRPYSPIKTLRRREGACRQYSMLTTAMLRAVDIDAKHITGILPNGDRHVWNEAKINGRNYALDTTWGL